MADAEPMQAAAYSDKSFIVYGGTKKWKDDLMRLGGRYNPNLSGYKGYIFSNKHQNAVIDFVNAANAGQVHPSPPAVQQPQIVQHVPPPVQRVVPAARLNIVQSPVPLAQISPITQISPKPVSPKSVVMLPSLPSSPVAQLPSPAQQVGFPSRFKGADNKTYQILLYTVPLPELNQKAILTFDGQDASLEYTVTKISDGVVDSIEITPITEIETKEVSRAMVAGGKWQVLGLLDPHTLTFI